MVFVENFKYSTELLCKQRPRKPAADIHTVVSAVHIIGDLHRPRPIVIHGKLLHNHAKLHHHAEYPVLYCTEEGENLDGSRCRYPMLIDTSSSISVNHPASRMYTSTLLPSAVFSLHRPCTQSYLSVLVPWSSIMHLAVWTFMSMNQTLKFNNLDLSWFGTSCCQPSELKVSNFITLFKNEADVLYWFHITKHTHQKKDTRLQVMHIISIPSPNDL